MFISANQFNKSVKVIKIVNEKAKFKRCGNDMKFAKMDKSIWTKAGQGRGGSQLDGFVGKHKRIEAHTLSHTLVIK